jgi:hypothetical protein
MLVSPPFVSMKTPRPASPSAPTSAWNSTASASRAGIGVPPSPLCCGAVELAKPTAPAAIASSTSPRIAAISSAVAARAVASSPMT